MCCWYLYKMSDLHLWPSICMTELICLALTWSQRVSSMPPSVSVCSKWALAEYLGSEPWFRNWTLDDSPDFLLSFSASRVPTMARWNQQNHRNLKRTHTQHSYKYTVCFWYILIPLRTFSLLRVFLHISWRCTFQTYEVSNQAVLSCLLLWTIFKATFPLGPWGAQNKSKLQKLIKNQFHCISELTSTTNRRAQQPEAEGPKLTPSLTVRCLNSKRPLDPTAASPVWYQECRSSGPARLLNLEAAF